MQSKILSSEVFSHHLPLLISYDAHLFVKNLGGSEDKINFILNNEEKYISFTKQIVVKEEKPLINEKGETVIDEEGKIMTTIEVKENVIEVKQVIRFTESFGRHKKYYI